jgi:DNA-binding MarR family transcriptional regulator
VSTRSRHAAPRLSYLVKWLERGLRAGLDEALGQYGVSTPEYTALSILNDRDGLSSAQLARRVFISAQAMNQIVIRLEEKGLIERREATHGRAMQSSLTPTGTTLLAVCDTAALAVEQRLLAGLSRSDAATLRELLTTCVGLLRREPGHVTPDSLSQ